MAAKSNETRYRGARAFWSGTISFGLVSIPVNLFPASHGRGAGLRMLGEDGTPLKRRFYCPQHERDVHPEHVIRGYELEDGDYVVITDEELESLAPRKSRDIDLTRFVDQADVPPMLFERGYYLTPSGDSTKAYRLLAEVMEKTGRVGIATFVMRSKEYLVAILAENGILRAETLRFHDELRTPEDVGLPERPRLKSQLVSKYVRAIKKDSFKDLDEADLQDDYAERLRKLAEKKHRAGTDVVEAKASEPTEADVDEDEDVDLLETIRRSLHHRNGKSHGSKNGHGRAENGSTDRGRRERSSDRRHSSKEDASKESLYERAKDLGITGRSHMTKAQLLRAIQRRS